MADKLRVGVVGAGRWSRSAHLPGFQRSPHSDLVAICDLNEDMAKEAASQFNIESVYTDFEAMLARDDIDVIDICTIEGSIKISVCGNRSRQTCLM